MKVQKSAERYLIKRQTLQVRKEECNNAIRDLGVLPADAFTKYGGLTSDRIVKRLHKVHDGLKKFAHVNKKAFEQYFNFTKQKDDLLKRREELNASAESIQELIETLDQRKDEAIERTFTQVSKYFEEVFERLVPAGKGELLMQKRLDGGFVSRCAIGLSAHSDAEQDEETEETNPDREKSEIDRYTGISIKVSFNSRSDEGQRIQQLSGGQKSLVALATGMPRSYWLTCGLTGLVFAIQRCDPAPFYLFDEIDANLDAQYRTAVACQSSCPALVTPKLTGPAMIHDLSSSAQFITTTFRPEMLAQADKFYGVYFDRQKVSTIQTIDKENCYEFIENAAQVGQL